MCLAQGPQRSDAGEGRTKTGCMDCNANDGAYLYDTMFVSPQTLWCVDDKKAFEFQVWPLSQRSRSKYLISG